MVMSAVSSVSTPGVLVTMMLRFRAVSRSILSTPVPNWAMSFKSGPVWLSTPRSMRSVTVGTSTLAVLAASISSSREKGLSSRLRRASNSSRSRVSTTSGSLRVTITIGRSAINGPARMGAGQGSSPRGMGRLLPRPPPSLTEAASPDKACSWLGPRSVHFSGPIRRRPIRGVIGRPSGREVGGCWPCGISICWR